VLSNVVTMLVYFTIREIDNIVGLRPQTRNTLERVESQTTAAHVAEHNHVKGRGGGTFVHPRCGSRDFCRGQCWFLTLLSLRAEGSMTESKDRWLLDRLSRISVLLFSERFADSLQL
jgi:hypothetical protein